MHLSLPRAPWSGRRLAGVLVVFTLLASACSSAASPAPAPTTAAPAASSAAAATSAATPAAAAAGGIKQGGDLRFMLLQDAQTYDPATTTESTAFTINSTVFDTLTELQPDGKIVPSLAESWTISDDSLTYTFKIRSGVKFHNGREMTAADAKYTLDRIKDPATKSPRVRLYGSVASIDAPDATTLVIKLSEPYAPLLATLSDISAGIVPHEAVEAEGGLAKHPVGTGPFKFVEWVRDQDFKVEANKDYWQPGLPHLASITFSFNSDSNARAAAVRGGTVDFLYDSPSALYDTLRADPSLQVAGGQGQLNWLYLLLNMQKDPFKDVRVRQAIYTTLDRDELAQVGMPGLTTVLNAGFLPPQHWAGVSDVVYKPDLAKAKQLLADAGVPDGFKFTINALTGWDFQIRTAQAIQQQLKPLGIDVNVNVIEAGQLLSAASSGDFDAQVLGFSGTVDPDERFQQTFLAGGGTNYVKFSDPQVEDLVKQARSTPDQDTRGKLYRQAQLRLADVGAFAFLYNYEKFDTYQKYVKGYVFNTQLVSYRSLRDVWLDK